MELFSACPFAVSTLAWEPAPHRRSLCVCVKGTFVLAASGVSTLAPLQEPIAADVREGEPGPSLAELVPFKPRADILISGHAYSPRGAPAEALIARARIGPFRKSLSITGDRSWVPSFDGLRPSGATPFRRMPLRYERAGRAGENLGGIDIFTQSAELGRALPNIAAIADQGGETPGFGPLPLPWRARRYGLTDAALLWASRVTLSPGPPPAGFDFRLFNAAPAEQQLDEIPPGIEIQLENLHPELARVDTRLPVLRVKLFRRAPRAERTAELPMRCDTLMIDADRGLCALLWRGAVLLDDHDETAVERLVVVAELEGEHVGAEQVDRFLALLAPPMTYIDAGVAFGLEPVQDPSAGSYPPPPPPPRAPSPGPVHVELTDDDLVDEPTPSSTARQGPTTLTPPAAPAPVVGALPFRPAPTGFEAPAARRVDSYPPPPPLSVVPHEDDGEVTPPRGFVPPVHERTSCGTLRPPPSVPAGAPSPLPTPPPDASVPSKPGTFLHEQPERTTRGTLRPPLPSLSGAERTPSGTLVPPTIGPTSTGLPFSSARKPLAAVDGSSQASLPLAVYAAIKVEVWKTEAPVVDVLARYGVDEATYRAHEREQAEAMTREAGEGKNDRAAALMEALRAARG